MCWENLEVLSYVKYAPQPQSEFHGQGLLYSVENWSPLFTDKLAVLKLLLIVPIIAFLLAILPY